MQIIILLLPLVISIFFTTMLYRKDRDPDFKLTTTLISVIVTSTVFVLFVPSLFDWGMIPVIIGIVVILGSTYALLGEHDFLSTLPSENTEKLINVLILTIITVIPFYITLTILRFTPWYIQVPISLIISIILPLLKLLFNYIRVEFFQNIQTRINNATDKKWLIGFGIVTIIVIAQFFIRIPMYSFEELINIEDHISQIERVRNQLDSDETATFELTIDESFNANATSTPYYYKDNGSTITLISESSYEVFDSTTKESLHFVTLPSSPIYREVQYFYNGVFYHGSEDKLYTINDDFEVEEILTLAANVIAFSEEFDSFFVIAEDNSRVGYYYEYNVDTETFERKDGDWVNTNVNGSLAEETTLYKEQPKIAVSNAGVLYTIRELNSKHLLEVDQHPIDGIVVFPYYNSFVKANDPSYEIVNFYYNRDIESFQVIRSKYDNIENQRYLEVLTLHTYETDIHLPFYTSFSTLTIVAVLVIFILPITDFKNSTIIQSFQNQTTKI